MNVVIVGAGPAGLMAAEVLATAGHDVSVYDQRRSPARKFVLAGRGGLNITHSEPIDSFLDRYGPERTHLEAALRAFTPDDLRAWCAGLGHDTFIGTSGRVFPEEFRAVPLLRSWLGRLDDLGVQFNLDHEWHGWEQDDQFRFANSKGSTVVRFDKAVLALGGASWPRVSSDGSWQSALAEQHVEVKPLRSANCGVQVSWTDVMVERFAGEPIKNSAVLVNNLAGESLAVRGDPIVSKYGLEGGPIYAHSRLIRDNLAAGQSAIHIDLFPDLEFDDLEDRLWRKKGESSARLLRRCGFSGVAAALLREVTNNELPKDAAEIAELSKAVPITVNAMAPIDRAISSSGGVAWAEVDDKFALRNAPNVSVVGEMLDWEAPTGGYLLQACMSTGRFAAESITP